MFRGGVHFTTLPPRLVTIDTTTGQAIASLTLAGCGTATGVAVRNDGLRVFVSCSVTSTSGAVLVIDPVAKQVVATRTFPQSATGVAVTPAGDRLVVPMIMASAEVLDAASLATVGTIAGTGTVPFAGGTLYGNQHPVFVSADGAKAYLTEALETSGRVVVVNLFTFTIGATIDFSSDNVTDIALTGNGAKLVVGHVTSRLSIVNTASDTVDAVVPIAGGASSAPLAAVAADGGARGFMAASSGVQVIDLASHSVTGQLPPTGAGPLAMNPAADRLSAEIRSTGAAGSTGMVASVNATTGVMVSSAIVRGASSTLSVRSPLR